MKRTTALILFTLSLDATYAEPAEGDRFYVGVALGESSVDGVSRTNPTIGLSPAPPASISIDGLPFDDTDTTWSAFAGYSFNRYLGVEVGYSDHGRFENDRLLGPAPASLGITEWSFGATLSYPLTRRLTLTGGAGFSYARFDVRGVATVFIIPSPLIPFPSFPSFPPLAPGGRPPRPGAELETLNIPLASPESEAGNYWQAGLQWAFTDKVAARLSYSNRELEVQEVDTFALAVIVSL